ATVIAAASDVIDVKTNGNGCRSTSGPVTCGDSPSNRTLPVIDRIAPVDAVSTSDRAASAPSTNRRHWVSDEKSAVAVPLYWRSPDSRIVGRPAPAAQILWSTARPLSPRTVTSSTHTDEPPTDSTAWANVNRCTDG